MSSPAKGRRRSSLSAAFENFRNKCRKTRIDSLLSPPKLDSGTSNDEDGSNSPSDWAGVPLTADSTSNKSPKSGNGDQDHKEESSNHSRCDSKLPEFVFENAGFETGSENGGYDSDATSPDENKGLTAALADLTAEATEAEDIGRYFSRQHHSHYSESKASERSEHLGPMGSMDTGGLSASASSMTGLLHSDKSGSTLDFEVGVPLQRTFAHCDLQQQWRTQTHTEPQTAEQSLVQSTYASLDEVVAETGWMEEGEEDKKKRRRHVPRTVDGLRLDARPLIRHSGTAAPPHSSLQLQTFSSRTHENKNSLDGPAQATDLMSDPTTEVLGISFQQRPQPTSWFSSDSESSLESIHLGYPSYRGRSTLRTNSPPQPPTIATKRHQTTLNPPSFSITNSSITYPSNSSNMTSAPRPPQTPKRKQKQNAIEYSHTPPTLSVPSTTTTTKRPSSTTTYTTLPSASSISTFHHTLTTKLNHAISTGEIHASQIPVKERVRRMSGAKSLERGRGVGGKIVQEGRRRVGRWGTGVGEAVVASGGLGIGWEERGGEEDGRMRRSGDVWYGGGFV